MTGSISSTGGGLDISALKQMQEKMFKTMDTNEDGKVDKSEMTAFQETEKSKGRKGGPSVDEIFSQQDSDNDGVIIMQEAEASIAKLAQQMQSREASGSGLRQQMKQNFENLGSALDSGNLEDAKAAFATLQENAPSGGNGNTPPEIEQMQSALESGDLDAAKQAYSQMQQKMAQGPPGGGAPPQGAGPATAQGGSQANSSESTDSASSNYDKMDLNEDGTVTAQEEFEYLMKHPGEKDTTKKSTGGYGTEQQTSSVERYA